VTGVAVTGYRAQHGQGGHELDGRLSCPVVRAACSPIGAFYETGLADRLCERDVDTVVMAGPATRSVESTARAAADYGFPVVFVADAMSGTTASEHETRARRRAAPVRRRPRCRANPGSTLVHLGRPATYSV
jgi:nicotinamidase-related amidase